MKQHFRHLAGRLDWQFFVGVCLCALATGCSPRDIEKVGGVRFTLELVPENGGGTSKADIESTIEVLHLRLHDSGDLKIVPGRDGRLEIEIPNPKQGPHDEATIKLWEQVLTREGQLHFYMASEFDKGFANDPNELASPGTLLLPFKPKGEGEESVRIPSYLLVQSKPEISGDHVDKAHAFTDGRNWGISLQFDRDGAEKFYELSKRYNVRDGTGNPGVPFAIVLDGVVLSSPVFNERIAGGTAQITGDFSELEARELAAAMAAPLPVPVRLVTTMVVEGSE